MSIEPLSSTELKVTGIPQPDSRADMYQMTLKSQEIDEGCMSYRLQEPRSCFYRGLEPGTEYTFIVHARAYAAGFDIVSETKEFSGSTPPNCEHIHSFLKTDMLIIGIIYIFLACFRETVNVQHTTTNLRPHYRIQKI